MNREAGTRAGRTTLRPDGRPPPPIFDRNLAARPASPFLKLHHALHLTHESDHGLLIRLAKKSSDEKRKERS